MKARKKRKRIPLTPAFFDEFDDLAGYVDAGGFFDAFEAGGAVDFDDHGALVAFHEVDAGDFKAKGFGGFDGGFLVGGGEVDDVPNGALVDVGAEFALGGGAHHGGDDFVANDEDAVVAASPFYYELLNNDVLV